MFTNNAVFRMEMCYQTYKHTCKSQLLQGAVACQPRQCQARLLFQFTNVTRQQNNVDSY